MVKRKKEIKSVYSSKVKRDFDENEDKCNAQSSKKNELQWICLNLML